MERWFLGIDAGDTAARAVVLDASGAVVARAEGPAAPVGPLQPDATLASIAQVARFAADRAGLALPCEALWVGVVGAGRTGAQASLSLALARAGLARTTEVGTDAEAAFHDAFEGGSGILLMAGTGSVAWGRGEDGREGRVGGWGSLLGDEGSGYAIGIESLRRVLRDEDGRGPETRLRDALLSHLGLARVDELVGWTAEAGRDAVAALVPVVVESSRGGDAVAGEILVRAVEELTGHVLTVLSNLGPWSHPPFVALAGTLLERGGPLRRAMELTLADQRLRPHERAPDTARGAAKLAFRSAALPAVAG